MTLEIGWGRVWMTSLFLAASGCSTPKRPPPKRNAAASNASAVSAALKSKGCGKTAAAVGEREFTVGTKNGRYIVSLPKAYDVAKPYPLGFAFHGRERNHKDCQKHDCAGFQDVMGEEAVLVYMQSLREPSDTKSGWERPAERAANLEFFGLVLAQLKADYCIDERRIFLAGTSSGGNFANLLGCIRGNELLAVAPVSAALTDPPSCQRAPAALVIHGIDDSHIPIDRGEAARESYRLRSGCAATTRPALADMHAKVRSARDQKPSAEILACVDYDGCKPESPLRWCEHSYGGWDGSTHGWPPNGGQVIWDFVKSLR